MEAAPRPVAPRFARSLESNGRQSQPRRRAGSKSPHKGWKSAHTGCCARAGYAGEHRRTGIPDLRVGPSWQRRGELASGRAGVAGGARSAGALTYSRKRYSCCRWRSWRRRRSRPHCPGGSPAEANAIQNEAVSTTPNAPSSPATPEGRHPQPHPFELPTKGRSGPRNASRLPRQWLLVAGTQPSVRERCRPG